MTNSGSHQGRHKVRLVSATDLPGNAVRVDSGSCWAVPKISILARTDNGGVGENYESPPILRYISETTPDGAIVTIERQ